MILLQASKVEKQFAGDCLFKEVRLQIKENDRVALVGRNGAGKSTLLKILVGEETPSKGEIYQKQGLAVSYLAQDRRWSSEQTVYEVCLSVFESLRKKEKELRRLEEQMRQVSAQELETFVSLYDQLFHAFEKEGGFHYETAIQSILMRFQFPSSTWHQRISDLSGGQKTRLALAKILLEKPDVLILDEPTNHLDMETIAWLENYLAHYQGAVLLVSHDRYFLDKIVTSILDLTPGGVTRYVGNYSSFVLQKEQKRLSEIRLIEKQKKEIAKLEEFVQKNIARASTSQRAKSRRKQLEKMTPLAPSIEEARVAQMVFPVAHLSGDRVVELKEATIGYTKTPLIKDLTIQVRKGEAIAIIGANGMGKTTFLKTLIGDLPLLKGQLQLGSRVEIGYYDQDQTSLNPQLSVLEEVKKDFSDLDEERIRSQLGAFLFSEDEVAKRISMLSGGEKARLLLTKLSLQKANVLLLDEPTNHLDLQSKEVLEQALKHFEGTILFVSHDRYFINQIATKVMEVSENGSRFYLGNYDEYLKKRPAQASTQEKDTKENHQPSQGDYQSQKQEQRRKRAVARRIEQLEQEIEQLEISSNQIKEEMSLTNDPNDLHILHEELISLCKKQDEKMAEWEEWSEKMEQEKEN